MLGKLLPCFLIVTLAAAQQQGAGTQAAQPADADKKLGSVEGKLIDANTGEPVRKANLVLMQMPTGGAILTGPPPSVATASDNEGKFAFTKVEPGRYVLSAEKTGYVRQQYGVRSGQFGPGTALMIEAGQKVGNLEFRLTPQAVITGKVLDEDGEPLANAMVQVFRQAPLARQPMGMMGMQTNDVGEFRIGNLVPGKYLVRAEYRGPMFGMAQQAPAAATSGEPSMGYVPTFYPAATDVASAAPVTVTAGQQVSGIDVQLRKARVYTVTGRVQGAPSGVRLQVSLQPQRREGGGFGFAFGGGGNVKPDGSFTLPSVQPGAYDIVAMSFDSGRPQTLARVPLNVANSNVENVLIQAGAPLEVTGRVIAEGDAETKITGQVMLQPGERVPMFTPPARIDENGAFKISGVAREKVFVQVMGLAPELYVRQVTAGNVDVTDTGLDLSKLDAAPPLEIRVSAKGATVEGVVMDGDKPAPGAMVTMLPQPYVPDRPFSIRKTASTDQNGRFSIKGIPPGEYRVYAWDSFVPLNDVDPEQLKQFEKFSATVKLKEEAREQVELKVAQLKTE